MMKEKLFQETEAFPEIPEYSNHYWHIHLPVSDRFIDSFSTPHSIRRQCISNIVERAIHLASLKPIGVYCRVVASISIPNLSNSQITVFFSEEYWSSFFDRNSDYQNWTLLPSERSLLKEFSIPLGDELYERGYSEIIRDEDFEHKGEIWFIGDL